MSQNLISLSFSDADLAAIDGALAVLEEKFAALIDLSQQSHPRSGFR